MFLISENTYILNFIIAQAENLSLRRESGLLTSRPVHQCWNQDKQKKKPCAAILKLLNDQMLKECIEICMTQTRAGSTVKE